MARKISDKSRKNLAIMVMADAAALLAAVFHQTRPKPNFASWAWIFLGFMIVLTLISLLFSYEEDDMIRGLPPEEKGSVDEDQ